MPKLLAIVETPLSPGRQKLAMLNAQMGEAQAELKSTTA
jgi:hypothetical protein